MNRNLNRRTLLGAIGATAMLPTLGVAVGRPLANPQRPALEASLLVGEPRAGQGGWRCAEIQGGRVTGRLLQGAVQSGRLEWLVDPASGAVQVSARVRVLRADGVLIELRDRSAHAGADLLAEHPGWLTAPELFEEAGGKSVTETPLAGRLDTADFAQGLVRLRAFQRA